MNTDMYETAKSLELVEVELYGCFILCSYLLLHKTLIIGTFYILKRETSCIPTYKKRES